MFGQYTWQLCLARFMNGFVLGGIFTCIPMFTAEFASDL